MPVIAITVPVVAILQAFFPVTPVIAAAPDRDAPSASRSSLLAGVILAPFGEELFFRGFATTAWAQGVSARDGASSRRRLVLRPRPRADDLGERAGEAFQQAVVAFGSAGPGRARPRLDLPATRGSIWASFGLHATFNGDPADRSAEAARRSSDGGVCAGGLMSRPVKPAVEPSMRAVSRLRSVLWGPDGGGNSAGFRRSDPGDARPPRAVPSGGPAVDRIDEADRRAAGRGRAIRELPLAERPRERLAQRGVAGLTSAELIGLVWGSGSRGRSAVDIAADALARHDGLTGLARATDVELAAVAGVGPARRPSWPRHSSWAGGCWPTGRRAAGRSADRTTSPTG